jgi:NADPH-dependent F420 reductase
MERDKAMENKPVIAILGGTGREGPGLAMRWATAGYSIIIGSRQEEKALATATKLNQSLGITSIRGMENKHACQYAEICVLTVVYTAHQSAIEDLAESLQGKMLIDATARVDFRDAQPPSAPSAARMAQERLGGEVKVVAAFQNVPAHMLKENLGQTLATDVLVCADDMSAAQRVIQLAKDGGMRAFYAGNLDNAVTVEGITALLIHINKHYGVKNASVRISGIE